MRYAILFLLFLLLTTTTASAQNHQHPSRQIDFPDIPGYQTLVTDLHIHTVFSDGSVWPNIRVEEALRDGLDAIAITDHLEYQPHQDDIPHPDRNRSYEIAAEARDQNDLIVIRGSEITRRMPPGHSNAIFIQDANPLLKDDSVAVFQEAKRQGAFVFWNHPMWTAQKPDGIASLTDLHLRLIREGMLHGIEVVNELSYSDEALQIALDHNLTIIGTSDIHGLIDWQYEVPHGGHRPVTLVFTTERSEAGLKEALMDGRTAVWFDEILIGREAWVRPLLNAAVTIASASYQDDTSVLNVVLQNHSEASFILQNQSDYTFHAHADLVAVAPHTTTLLQVKTGERLAQLTLEFEVLNAVTAPNQHPVVSLSAPIE